MSKGRHPGLLLNKKKGFTLIEILVALGILSVLMAVAVPYAQMSVKRAKEAELTASLRVIRTAIDGFYKDYKEGKISKMCDCASEFGYPKNLLVLVEGVSTGEAVEKKLKYLRRIPANPFERQDIPAHEQWGLRSYADSWDSWSWSGEDVYDVFAKTDRKAIDGSDYASW